MLAAMLDAPPLRRAAGPGLEIELRAIRTSVRRWPAHWHADLQLIATVDGCGEVWIEGESFRLPPGSLVIIPPQTAHTAHESDAKAGWTFLSLHVAPERLALLPSAVGPRCFEPDDPVAAAFRRFAARLFSPSFEEGWRDFQLRLASVPGSIAKAQEPLVRGWRCRLADLSAPERPIAAIAADLGLSRRTFERCFRAAFHLSPHRWRLIARVEVAKAALRDGAPVAEAARSAGYDDLRHFSRQFRQITGITARAYGGPFRHRRSA